jgi:hypothetical protein
MSAAELAVRRHIAVLAVRLKSLCSVHGGQDSLRLTPAPARWLQGESIVKPA